VRDEQTKTDSDTEKTMILWARAEDHEDRDSEDANEVGGHDRAKWKQGWMDAKSGRGRVGVRVS
jgi:hypothetical protein